MNTMLSLMKTTSFTSPISNVSGSDSVYSAARQTEFIMKAQMSATNNTHLQSLTIIQSTSRPISAVFFHSVRLHIGKPSGIISHFIQADWIICLRLVLITGIAFSGF